MAICKNKWLARTPDNSAYRASANAFAQICSANASQTSDTLVPSSQMRLREGLGHNGNFKPITARDMNESEKKNQI